MATRTAPRTPTGIDESTQTANTDESLPSLAEVLDRVASHGPQIITRGEDRFVVLEAQEMPVDRRQKRLGFIDALLSGPRFDGVEIEREPWIARDIEL